MTPVEAYNELEALLLKLDQNKKKPLEGFNFRVSYIQEIKLPKSKKTIINILTSNIFQSPDQNDINVLSKNIAADSIVQSAYCSYVDMYFR